jgi:hypothetical protein
MAKENETELKPEMPPVENESIVTPLIRKKFLQLRCYQCAVCGENVSNVLEPEDMEKMSCPNLKCDSNRPPTPVEVAKPAEVVVASQPKRVPKSWVASRNK